MQKTFSLREMLEVVIPVLLGAILIGFLITKTGLFQSFFVSTRKPENMSDHDRTAAIVQRWAHMGATKPSPKDQLATLWSPNQAMAFWPDACQLLTADVQTAFPERPGLAKGDLRVKDFNDPKNPNGRIKSVDDLATAVMESPRQ
jgi:hypothetical protein